MMRGVDTLCRTMMAGLLLLAVLSWFGGPATAGPHAAHGGLFAAVSGHTHGAGFHAHGDAAVGAGQGEAVARGPMNLHPTDPGCRPDGTDPGTPCGTGGLCPMAHCAMPLPVDAVIPRPEPEGSFTFPLALPCRGVETLPALRPPRRAA